MYTKTYLEEIIKIENVYTIHYFKYAKNFSFQGEKHNFWEFVYVDSGEVGVTAGDQKYSLSQGEIIFHKPNEYHSIWAADKFANVVVVSFECESQAIKFFEEKIMVFSSKFKFLLSDIIAEAKTAFSDPLDIVDLQKLAENDAAKFASKQIIKMRLEEVLIRLHREDNVIMPKTRMVSVASENQKNILIENINNYLKNHVDCAINLDNIIKEFSFSKSYIVKLYREITGVSIMDFFISLKIDEAKKMISEKKYSVSEISDKLAFSSIHYFSKCFKKRTNMTPSEYSRSIESENILL